MSRIVEQLNPKVSVIIPTYKRDLFFVSRAISSLVSQSYNNIEIVVIDDSPDTYEKRREIENYIKKLSKSDYRIVYLKNECNMGGSLSRNRGIENAKGSLITFLDDDDEYKPCKIEKQVEYMLNHDCDMSFSNMVMYNNKGVVVDKREYHDIPAFDNDTLLKYHLMRHMTGTATFMYRAEKLREIGGFDDVKIGQEFYLMLKTIKSGLKIGYIDTCDVIVYKHGGEAITNGKNKINGENNLYEFKKTFFHLLDKKQIRFIKFRHHAVMVVAYIRNKMFFHALAEALRAFVSSPIIFFEQVFLYCKNTTK